MEDWSTVLQGFAIGAFPWISQMKALKIHFVSPLIDVAGVSNFFASLLSVSVFAYLQYAHPSQAINLPAWWVGILCAGVLIIAFVTHFIFFRADVESGKNRFAITIHLTVYVLIFLSLTTGFGTLKLLENHYLMAGNIRAGDGTAVHRADIRLLLGSGDIVTEGRSDDDGEYKLLILKSDAAKVRKIEVITEGYEEYGKQVADVAHLLSGYREIWISKPPQNK